MNDSEQIGSVTPEAHEKFEFLNCYSGYRLLV